MTEGSVKAEELGQNAPPSPRQGSLGYELISEFICTFILIFIGNGAVVVSVALSNATLTLFQVGIVWGVAVALAIYAGGAISGAHINPAVTITFAAFTDFPWRRVIPYVVAQILAAFVASVAIYASFSGVIRAFEAAHDIVRGEPGSQASAMMFTIYAPNPAIVGTDPAAVSQVSLPVWFFTEVIMTALLLFVVFYIVDELNAGRPLANVGPIMIGLVVMVLTVYGGAITMTSLNPARDLGPRFFTLLAGWGSIAFPGPRGGFWIASVGPIVGGLLGGALYHYLFKRGFPLPAPPGEEPAEVVGR